MKTLLVVALLMSLGVLGCSSDSGSSGSSGDGLVANESEPLYDKGFFAFANISSTEIIADYFKVTSGSTVVAMMARIEKTTGRMSYRRMSGTFTRSGSTYTVSFTQTTCPADRKTIAYDITGDASSWIFIKPDTSPTAIKYYNEEAYVIPGLTDDSITSTTEDVNCNLVAQTSSDNKEIALKTSNDRRPASSRKSIWPAVK